MSSADAPRPQPLDYAPPPPGVDRKAVYTLMLINFIDLMGFGLVVLLLPFYALKFAATPVMIAAILATFSLCQFIGAPLLGAWSDRVGRRPVLMFSQWGSVVGYLLLSLSMWVDWSSPQVGLAVIFLSRMVDGFTAGNITVTNAYVADVIPAKERAGVIGLLGAAFGLGFAFGPPIGGLLGAHHAALPGLLAAGMSAIASLCVWRFLPESHTNRTPTNAGRFAFSPDRVAAFRAQPMVVGLTLVWFLSMLAYVMLEPTVPLILRDAFGYGQREAGFFFGAVGCIIILVQGGLVRPLNKRFGEWPLALIGTAAGAMGLILYATQVHAGAALWIVAIAAICNATGRSLQTPTLSAMVSQNADPKTFGASYGVYQGSASLGRVFGPLLGGFLYERHPSIMFLVGACFLFGAAGVLVVIRPRLRSSRASANDRPQEPAAPVVASPTSSPVT